MVQPVRLGRRQGLTTVVTVHQIRSAYGAAIRVPPSSEFSCFSGFESQDFGNTGSLYGMINPTFKR